MSRQDDFNEKSGATALLNATLAGDIDKLKDLLWNGADVRGLGPKGCPWLMHAACGEHAAEKTALFIEYGADVNEKDSIGITPLLYAATLGQKDVVKVLLDNGANTHVWDDQGNTPLMYAALKGNEETVSLLLAHGADPRLRSDAGFTARDAAEHLGKTGIVALLDAADPPAAVHRPPQPPANPRSFKF